MAEGIPKGVDLDGSRGISEALRGVEFGAEQEVEQRYDSLVGRLWPSDVERQCL